MTNQETSICPSGPSYFENQPCVDQIPQETQIILSELDQMTFSLRNLLQKLDNLKTEVSTNKTSSCDLRNKLSMIMKQGLSAETCQSFLEKISQASIEFQEFIKTDKLVRVPSIEQPNQTCTKANADLNMSEIIQIDLLEFDEDEGKIEEDYKGLFKDVSPIASHENDNTFSRDCYYFENQEESFVEEDVHETIIISENVNTMSMSSSHVDLVEVEKNNGNRSSEDHDMSTELSIEFEINTHQDNTFDEDGMILKLLEKEEALKMAAFTTTLDLGSAVDLNVK